MTEIKYKRHNVVKNRYSRYIALPPLWCQEHDVEPGDRVDMIRQEDGTLRIEKVRPLEEIR